MATRNSKPETLRSVTLDVIGNYQRTARSAAASARAGGTKGMAKVDSAIDSLVDYEGKISKTVKNSLATAQKKVTVAADKADKTTGSLGKKAKSALNSTRDKVVKATNKADDAVEKLLSRASKKIAQFPSKGTRMSKFLDNNIVASVEPLGVRGAKLLRSLSATLAEGAEKISAKVGDAKKSATVKKVTAVKKTADTTRRKTPLRRANKTAR
jgi:hypothetical protein